MEAKYSLRKHVGWNCDAFLATFPWETLGRVIYTEDTMFSKPDSFVQSESFLRRQWQDFSRAVHSATMQWSLCRKKISMWYHDEHSHYISVTFSMCWTNQLVLHQATGMLTSGLEAQILKVNGLAVSLAKWWRVDLLAYEELKSY